MKNKFFLILVIFFALTACDDLFQTEISTTLEMSVPVTVSESAVAVKSANLADTYTFTKSGSLSLTDDEEINDHIDKLKAITLENLEVDIFGLSTGQEIISLTINVTGVGEIASIANVTSASGTFTPNVSSTLLDEVAAILLDDQAITVTINGTSNYAPMSFNVELAFDALVTAGLL